MENQEYIQKITQKYKTLGYEPQPIPRDNIKHLRGSQWCIDLKNLENIDTVAILAQKDLYQNNKRLLYTFEYALRGNIKGISPDRKIIHTETKWKGIIRKKLITAKWNTSEESETDTIIARHGTAPSLGEIYEGSPYTTLASLLNKDKTHNKLLKEIIQTLGSNTRLTIYSDKWDESIRFSCNIWAPETSALEIYTSPLYLETAKNTSSYIKVLRKQFGGLTF